MHKHHVSESCKPSRIVDIGPDKGLASRDRRKQYPFKWLNQSSASIVMDQQVKEISIEDLVLWTENPRDPIDPNATDQDIVDRALDDKRSKWTLSKLAREMGDYYDFSELPTVVYHGNKPVVYDGNRRMILGKIKHGLVSVPAASNLTLPDFPTKIPCNVCVERIALNNIYRKHADTGSWQPLERDLFLHRFMKKDKSAFLVLEEKTGLIGAHPHLNQRFVKEEILSPEILKSLGFSIQDETLHSAHTVEEARTILSDIARKVEQKAITTRKNRGKVIEVLDPSTQQIIDENKQRKQKPVHLSFKAQDDKKVKKRRTRRKATNRDTLFGGPLYLQIGEVSNLYRDIVDLHDYYLKNKSKLSDSFPGLIRMALRLLCETAAKNSSNSKIDNYLKKNFITAKASLTQDQKTTLANHNITEVSIVQLLHTGAHSYSSSDNIDQTIALSIIIGAILTETYGRDD